MQQQPHKRASRGKATSRSARKPQAGRPGASKPPKNRRNDRTSRKSSSRSKDPASRMKQSAGASPAVCIIAAVGVIALMVLIAAWPRRAEEDTPPRARARAVAAPSARQPSPEISYDHTRPTKLLDQRALDKGFPSKAEDLYREGHALLDEALPNGDRPKDPRKLKAALRKLDAAVDGYFELEKKHPDNECIKARINKINKLRAVAHKSYTL